MARSAEVNKSQAIRDYKSKHKRSKPRDIATALQAEGYDVNAQYVSVVLSNARKNKGKKKTAAGTEAAVATTGKKRGRPSASASSATVSLGNGIGIPELKLAKQLMHSAGGAKQARKALDAIAELMH